MVSIDPVPQNPANEFVGPDALARAVIEGRKSGHLRPGDAAEISEEGLLRLIQVAYHASQLPNEGRFPRLTLFFPAPYQRRPGLNTPIQGPLTVPNLRRLGPVLEAPELCLVVEERNGTLEMVGINSRARGFTELTFGEPLLTGDEHCHGLTVEILGPGDLRAGEALRHRLSGGRLRQEMSYHLEDWFLEWADGATRELLGREVENNPNCGVLLGGLWDHLIWRIAAFHHGGCLVILPDPTDSTHPIRHTFTLQEPCDLGRAFAWVFLKASFAWQANEAPIPKQPTEEQYRQRLQYRQTLLATLDTIARLSATDGCLVFNRRLQLHSFGSMIEPVPTSEAAAPTARPPCYNGDTDELLPESLLVTFGARRRSAIQLCQACPGALAFIVSQDGDLRAVVRRGDVVRLYDNLTVWADG